MTHTATAEWFVSTLVPGLHGQPSYRPFNSSADAVAYARNRARSGKRIRDGGKAYFVITRGLDTPEGALVYRVFRAFRGQEQRPGGGTPEPKREFVMVQRPSGTLPNGKTRWVMDEGLSVEIPHLERERELVRLSKGPRRLTRWDRQGDPR